MIEGIKKKKLMNLSVKEAFQILMTCMNYWKRPFKKDIEKLRNRISSLPLSFQNISIGNAIEIFKKSFKGRGINYYLLRGEK